MKRRYLIAPVVPFCLVLALMACGPVVSTTKMTSRDLGAYKTFAYLPNGNFGDTEGYMDETVGVAVIENVNENMKKLGYELDRKDPDLLVLITTTVDREKIRVKEPVYATYPDYYSPNIAVGSYYEPYYYYNYAGYNELIGYDVSYDSYKEGTLLVQLVDSGTKQVVWKGEAYNFISEGQNSSSAIARYVDDIFDDYPRVGK